MALNTYAFSALKTAVESALGRAVSARSTSGEIVNNALAYLALHPWQWRQRPLSLDFTAYAITSLVRASNVVTLTRNSHGLVTGDSIKVTGASTGFDGTFTVASTATANTLTYAQSGDDETASTPGSYIPAFVALPADFGQLQILHRNSVWRACRPTSLDRIVQCRLSGVVSAEAFGFYYAITSQSQAAVTSASTYRLELFPPPQAAETGALAGVYLRVPAKLANDTDLPDIPAPFHVGLHRLCRAFAVSDEREQRGEDWRIWTDELLPRLQREDGGVQTNLGPTEGGVGQCDGAAVADRFYPSSISPA